MPDKSSRVKAARRIFVLGAIVLSGCHTAHDVAVTSFRVLDAPANFVRRRIDPPQQTTTTTTTTTAATSDVVTPGRTVTTAPTNREKPRRQTTTESRPSPTATPHVTRNATVEKPKPSPTPAPRNAATTQPTQYPTAKPVPGKSGYVFSPFDPSGGYVDVNGYTPGSKVKDPYSGKIFLVP
jgi:hypothetical protein